MKRLLAGVAALFLFACRETSQEMVTPHKECFDTQVVKQLTHIDGKIEKVAEFYLILAGEQRYAACNLPEELQVAGTRIQFDAKEFEIPANVRLAGTPILITKIY